MGRPEGNKRYITEIVAEEAHFADTPYAARVQLVLQLRDRGAGPFIDGEIATAEADGDEALAGALRDRRNEENGIRDRFGERYSYGSDELIRFAEAYREWCREQYGDEEVGA